EHAALELFGRHAGTHLAGEHVEAFGGEPPGLAHGLECGRTVDLDLAGLALRCERCVDVAHSSIAAVPPPWRECNVSNACGDAGAPLAPSNLRSPHDRDRVGDLDAVASEAAAPGDGFDAGGARCVERTPVAGVDVAGEREALGRADLDEVKHYGARSRRR